MDTTKNIIISALVAGIITATAAAFMLHSEPAVQMPKQPNEQQFGAISGPDIASAYLKWGLGSGVALYPTGISPTNASTTCSFLTPAATSTLKTGWGFRFTTGSSSALFIEAGKAANAYSTTTSITTFSIAAGAQAMFHGTTTPGLDTATSFPPSSYFNIKIGGGGTGTLPTGVCNATFETFP